MAYLALYRAFRPETLSGVVRQEHIVKILRNQIEQDRIGHAYLFCGPRGTGKTSIAKIFARLINCEHPINGAPCGECPACKAMQNGNSLDIMEIDAASNNGVDEMRDLREKIQYPPVNGRYKVYIIDEVHMLSAGAFNALLKTLEEPPKHAVFILATTEAQKIPATILSRCMRFDFKLIPLEDLENHLKFILQKMGKDYEEEAVAAIARAGAGSVRDMLSIADMCISYDTGKLTYDAVNSVLGSADFLRMSDLCDAILQGNAAKALSLTEQILSEGKGIGMLVKDILQFLNNCAIAKMCRNSKEILCLPQDMFDKVKSVADGANGARLLRTTEIFATAESSMRYSSSARILLETAVIKAGMPETDYDVEALLSRICALEEKVKNGITVSATTANIEPVAAKSIVKTEPKVEKEPSLFDDFPPLEEPMFDDGFFSPEEVQPPVRPTAKSVEKSVVKEVKTVKEPSMSVFTPSMQETAKTEPPVARQRSLFAQDVAPMPEMKHVSMQNVAPMPDVKSATTNTTTAATVDKSKAFGLFLRSLRKNSKNGVLFTMCSELDSTFEGDKMVFYTTSETIVRSLQRPEHDGMIKQALEAIGVFDYEIRLRGAKADNFTAQMEELKKNFPDTPIKIK